MNLYTEKETGYFSNVRYDLIKLLPANSENRVLELGSGGGDTLIELKKKKLVKEAVGVELMKIENSNQSSSLLDKFIIANVEEENLPLPEAHFDAILIGDVLEHLSDPWKTIAYLSTFLKTGGVFIVSVPNIRFYTALFKIAVQGDFAYQERGLFDKTHLRFFCKKNIRQLFTTPFLKLKSITAIESVRKDKPSFKSLFNLVTFRVFEEFLTLQYIVVAAKI